MKQLYLFLSLLLLLSTRGFADTFDDGAKLLVSRNFATGLSTNGQWYLLHNTYSNSYINEGESSLAGQTTTNCATGNAANDKQGFLFKLSTGSTDGTYKIVSAKGHSFSLAYDDSKSSNKGSSTLVTEKGGFKDFKIVQIGDNAGYYYIQQTDNSIVAHSNGQTSALVGWTSTPPQQISNSASVFRLRPVRVAVVSDAYCKLFTLVESSADYDIGTDYGQLQDTDDFEKALSAAKALLGKDSPTDDELNAACTTLENAEKALTFVTPADGSFIRIQSYNSSKAYLSGKNSSTNANRVAYVAGKTGDNEATTIFYYKDSKLLSYETGIHLASTTDYPQAYYNGIGNNTTVNFQQATTTGNGAYNVKFYSDTRYLYAQNDNYSDAGNDNTSPDAQRYTFDLEAVASLPITISSAGYATLYVPVALTIPEGITAYIVTAAKTNKVILQSLGDGIIPANTGVVLKGSPGTYSFALSATEATTPESSKLTGSPSTQTYNQEKNYYILANGTVGVGFYLMNSTTDRNIHGFRAFYVEEKTSETSTAKAFSFLDDETTAIISMPQGAHNAVAPIHDLQGRRIANPTKGIYIQGGHKTTIK